MSKTNQRTIPVQYNRALVVPSTIDEERREVDIVFATETPVERWNWEERYMEVLVCEKGAVRLERADAGLPALDSHSGWSVDSQLGRTVKVWFNDNRELCATVRFSKKPTADRLFQDIKDGIVTAVSVGYRVHEYTKIDNGQDKIPTYRATDWEPYEVSFVAVPADHNCGVRSAQQDNSVHIITRISNKKIMAKRTEGTTVEYTVEGEAVKQGDIITLDDGQEGVALQDGDEGETITLTIISGESGNDDGDEGRNNDGDDDEGRSNDGDDDGTSDGDDDEGKRSTRGKNKTRTAPPASKRSAKPKTPSEGRRMDEILLVTEAAGLPYEDAVELYRSNKTIEECREAVHKKAMEKQARSFNGGHSTVTVGRSGNEKMMNAMQGAILHRVLPGQFKLEGDAKDFRAYTVTDYARDLMAAHGINARTMTPAEVADAIFKRAYGTSDFPILMEGAIEKILLAPYQTEEECWDKISKPHTFRDFREKGFYRGDSENGMVERKEGAEIKYTTFIEGKETMRLRSFSQGIRLTREAIINDDLDVFSQIPQTFGNNWNELRGDLVWGVYTDNPKMSDGKSIFHADHKNTIELGLTAAGLSAARVQFRRQTKPGTNRPLKVSPKYLIVPPELETAAELLMAQITATETEKVNPFSKKYTILVESRLTDPKAWYLAADPNACTSVVHGYLDGSENLRVNTKENFDNDTIDYAVRGDFAAGAIDHRGILKSTGTK